jgi:hypothetical protein
MRATGAALAWPVNADEARQGQSSTTGYLLLDGVRSIDQSRGPTSLPRLVAPRTCDQRTLALTGGSSVRQ